MHKDKSISGNSLKAEGAFKAQYPALYNHLSRHKEKLSNRNKEETGIRYEWYALQRCAASYYKDFEKEKIVWGEIVQSPQFYYDANKYYPEATAFIMTGEHLKYLTALLNSHPTSYFFKTFYMGGGLGEKGYRYQKAFIEKLPVPQIPEEEQKPFTERVDRIMALKKQGKDTAAVEKEIDAMVYKIYGLGEDEVAEVEKALG